MSHLKKFASKILKKDSTMVAINPVSIFGTPLASALTFKNFPTIDLSRKDKTYLVGMKIIQDREKLPFLVANQVSLDMRAFILNCDTQSWKDCIPSFNFKYFINPTVQKVSNEIDEDWEYSPNFPFMRASVRRYREINFEYLDQEFQEQEIKFEGFQSRLVQICIDQLNGFTIIDPRISCGKWELLPEFIDKMPKMKKAIEYYRAEVDKLLIHNPEHFKMRDEKELNTKTNENIKKFSFESMMVNRFSRYAEREYVTPILLAGQKTNDNLYEHLKNTE